MTKAGEGGRGIRSIAIAAGILVSLMIIPCTSVSLLLSLTLDEMIANSDIIIVGIVTNERTAETKTTVYYDEDHRGGIEVTYSFAEVAPIRYIRGRATESRAIKIMFATSLSDAVVFEHGEKAIFFIQKNKGDYRLTQGLNGKISVLNDMVSPVGIRDEPREQRFDQFVRRIEEKVKRMKGT